MKLNFDNARLCTAALALTAGLTALHAQSPALGTQYPLYAIDAPNNQILKISSNGTSSVLSSLNLLFFDTFPPSGLLAVDKSGTVYVSVPVSASIVKIDPLGNQSVFFAGDPYNGTFPWGLAFDSQGNLWATNPNIFTSGTSTVMELDPTGNIKKQLTVPCSVSFAAAFDQSESNLFVDCADALIGGTSSIVKVPVSGAAPTTIASGGLLVFPYAEAFDSKGDLFIADIETGILEETGGSSLPTLRIRT